MGRNRVAKGVAEREVAAKRSILRREDDWRALLNKMVMQGVSVVAAEPDSDAPAKPVGIS